MNRSRSSARCDVAVIGAGIVGLAQARSAAKRGTSTVVPAQPQTTSAMA